MHWSRGRPHLPQVPKTDLFGYLGADAPSAESRAESLCHRFRLQPLARQSTRELYRKNLYLLELLERATEDIGPLGNAGGVRAVDVGAQDWHYVFALERWLRYRDGGAGRPVELRGVEVDGYGIYPDFHSRRDYALAYAGQTDNPHVTYQVADFVHCRGENYDVVTLFYPFVTRPHLLLWGLPLRFFTPPDLLASAAAMTRIGGLLVVLTHTRPEHDLFLDLVRAGGAYDLLREGLATSDLVSFHAEVQDRRFSVWRRRASIPNPP